MVVLQEKDDLPVNFVIHLPERLPTTLLLQGKQDNRPHVLEPLIIKSIIQHLEHELLRLMADKKMHVHLERIPALPLRLVGQ